MHKHPSCSFHSSQSPLPSSQLSSLEHSILAQYNRLMQDSSSTPYTPETLPYSPPPKFLTPQIKSSYKQCIYLDKFTFYEMFTMLIVEYLFKCQGEVLRRKRGWLKMLVCEEGFLEGSAFTKGLIVRGFKAVQELAGQKDCHVPLGSCLLNCDSICAFTELWKQLILKICTENNMPNINENQIDSSIFQLFASYFHINFDVYWKEKNNKLWKQHFTYHGANSETDTLAVVVNPEYQISVSQRSIKVTESRASGNSSSNRSVHCWNYMILTNPVMGRASEGGKKNVEEIVSQKISQKAQLANGEEISRISERDYSCGETEEIKILLEQKISESQTAKKVGKFRKEHRSSEQALANILGTMSKANYLIEQMRKYSEYLESIESPTFNFSHEGFSAL